MLLNEMKFPHNRNEIGVTYMGVSKTIFPHLSDRLQKMNYTCLSIHLFETGRLMPPFTKNQFAKLTIDGNSNKT